MAYIELNDIIINPTQPQPRPINVEYKVVGQPDSAYAAVSPQPMLNQDGTFVDGPLFITGLASNTEYTVRISSNCAFKTRNIRSSVDVTGPCDFTSIPNLITWIDVTDLDTVTISGGAAYLIQDKSTVNNDFQMLEQAPDVTIGYNSLPALNFFGAPKMQSSFGWTNTSDYTFIIVGDIPVARGMDNNGGGWSVAAGNATGRVIFEANGIGDYTAGVYEDTNSKISSFTIKQQIGNSEIKSYDNNFLKNSLTAINNSQLRTSPYGFVLGATGSLGNNEVGLFHELIIFSRVLTNEEMESIHTCLRYKYGFPSVQPTTSTTTTLAGPTTSTTTTIPCFVVIDIEGDTNYIIDGLGNDISEDSTNIINHS